MTSVDYGIGDAVSPGPNKTSCMAFMREHCQPGYQDRMMTMEMPRQDRLSDTNQTVASFIVTRPPVAYLGWGWESGDDKWNDIFLLQVRCVFVYTSISDSLLVRKLTHRKNYAQALTIIISLSPKQPQHQHHHLPPLLYHHTHYMYYNLLPTLTASIIVTRFRLVNRFQV